jgi:tol-pal system protein YbgF
MIATVETPAMTLQTFLRQGVAPLCLALIVCGLALPVRAQQGGDLANRVDRLERGVSVLNQQVFRGQAPSLPQTSAVPGATAVAGLEVRVQQLEASLAQATGKMEELSYNVRRLQDDLAKLGGDIEFRFQELEKRAAPVGAQPEPAAVAPPAAQPANRSAASSTPAPAAPSQILGTMPTGKTSDDPQQSYNDAFALLRGNDYAGAEAALKAFIASYPDNALRPNAQYWLGETFYARNDYRSAAVAFAEGYQSFPKSKKAPDSLLKLGLSLSGMNQKDDACLTFSRLLSEYPTASSTLRGLADRQRERLGC